MPVDAEISENEDSRSRLLSDYKIANRRFNGQGTVPAGVSNHTFVKEDSRFTLPKAAPIANAR